MKIIIRITTIILLAIGCTYIAKPQACTGTNNNLINQPSTSSALGSNNTVSVNNSTAIGKYNTISYTTSTNPSYTIGDHNSLTKPYSIALGSDNNVNATSSIVIGYNIKNITDYGITIGRGNTTQNLKLINNTEGIMMGTNSNIPTLYISNSIGVNYTGKIGIGNVTSPSAKLHIKADSSGEGEDADIMLEPTASGKYAAIYFKTKDNYIRLRNVAGLDFNAPRYNFLTGKVSIGNVSAQQATLHIKANSGENANIMLQTTDNTKDAAIIFRNTSNTISVGSNNLMNFAATSYSFTTGKVGIGTKNPSCKLEVAGSAKTTSLQTGTLNVTGDVSFGNLAGNTTKIVTVGTDGKLNAKSGLFIADNGNVRIGSGTGNPSKALEVNGTIRSKEVIVEVANWSDFVFDNNYNLMSLKETERFIKQNGHLPNVPSAAEVEKDGVQLGEMNAILLQKVEELMLYVIELEKKIDSLEKEYTRKE